MDVFIFNAKTNQNRLVFAPGVPYGFEDPDACPFFKACGWGDFAEAGTDPVITITAEELDIDPCIMWADDNAEAGRVKGKFVMPERAAAHRGTTLEEAQAWKWDGVEDPRNPGQPFIPQVIALEDQNG